ncbi:MAG: phosphoenolpyruvate carboxylase [Bacteroidota bacterium]
MALGNNGSYDSLELYKKFQMYNSLFLNLYYQEGNPIGHLIPLLTHFSRRRLNEGESPVSILDEFVAGNHDVIGEDKLGFMFKVIQYVERQIVLFDSIEDVMNPSTLEDNQIIEVSDLLGEDINAKKEVVDKLNKFGVRIVLTAHPTQFYRPPVLNIIAQLRKEIGGNNIENIDLLLHQLGLTSLVNSKSPTPLDEARNIIHICRYFYYHAIGNFYTELLRQVPELDNPELLTLGFWPCGDRDGNPYVTHETTRQVIHDLRMTLMKCYYNELKELATKLTFKEAESEIVQLRARIYKAMFSSKEKISYTEILDSLTRIEHVVENKYEGLYLTELQLLMTKVRIFKNHLASLDIRQDMDVHRDTVTAILQAEGIIKKSLDELSDEALVDHLINGNITIDESEFTDSLVKDTILNIRQLPELQDLNGEAGCHRYIISNSEDKYSVLFVFGLFRWIHPNQELAFDIIPLFETMRGMSGCDDVMEELFSIEAYRDHLKRRGETQVMMLGFSDGTKDGGYLSANWSIYRSKERLSAACEKHRIRALFFDGRGGPPARGGGKTHKFYAALGPGIANNGIQITIQGQTITSTYGTEEKFKFNAEQMVSAGLYNHVHQSSAEINESQRKLIEELSEISYVKYKELKAHSKFLPYLEHMTTLKYYSDARIGSRPTKRNKSSRLTLSDLRAISYVGAWSQLKQNIPGYFGIGTAISALRDEDRLEEIKALYRDSPFFANLIGNCMMSLTKCFFSLTSYMQESKEYGDFWNYLHAEYELSKEVILQVTGLSELMENEQRSRNSIRIREEIVLPLILVQNYALQMIQSGKEKENEAVYKKLVKRSLYGNINASRNSA